jgi:periplasmic divalent cation tolerance protein
MHAFVAVVTTLETEEDARRLGAALLERRLAACVQITGPVESSYRWCGGVETAREWCCTIKTRAALFEEVARAIAAAHAYEVPEIVAYPITALSDSYRAWLDEALKAAPP